MLNHSTYLGIPSIDLSGYFSNDPALRNKCIQEVGTALETVGFFSIQNHKVCTNLIQEAYSQSSAFFNLNKSSKLAYTRAGSVGFRGFMTFAPSHTETVFEPQYKEGWHMGRNYDAFDDRSFGLPNFWPDEVPNLESSLTRLYQELDQCALTLLDICSIYLGEEANLLRGIAEEGDSLLRTSRHPCWHDSRWSTPGSQFAHFNVRTDFFWA